MLFVIQIMLIVKIQSVSSVQDLFLRQFFGVRHSICQCLLAAHIRLVFSVPSCRYYNIVLMFVYVFPPVLLVVYVGFAELLYPFQICFALAMPGIPSVTFPADTPAALMISLSTVC